MIHDHSKSHNLADEQLDKAHSDRDGAGSEVDLMLSNARLQPLADLSELCASAPAHSRRPKPRSSGHGREPEGIRVDNNNLVFPTDGAALLFALLIFGVAIFKLN